MVMGELEQETQLLVIGSGPGGYAAAFRAADLGLEVTMVDAAARPGGACLFRGCIPAKTFLFLAALIHDAARAEAMGVRFGRPRIDLAAVRQWKDRVVDGMASGLESLCRQRGVQLLKARAQFEDPHTVRLQGGDIARIRFAQAVVATGSQARPLEDPLSGSGSRIMTSGSALALAEVPQRLLVVGGGYTGLELGMIYASLGSRVRLVELGDRLLPEVDADLVAPLQQRVAHLFEAVHLRSRVVRLQAHGEGVTATLEGPDAPADYQADRVVVAVGRQPATRSLGLERAGVERDADGFVQVDDHQRTSVPHILAAGDVCGGPLLAHKASREGKVAAEVAAGRISAFDVRAIPVIVYTDPQIAWCGMSEKEARKAGRPVAVRRFPWKFSGRAATMGAPEGMTKIIADADSGRIVGAGMVGRETEGLIAEAVLAIEMGALAEDLALSVHPHPTLSETESEAAELFLGSATHLVAAEDEPEK